MRARIDGVRRAALGVLPLWIGFVAALPAPAQSGFYHNLDRNHQPCTDCHTLHYEEDGAAPPEGEPGGPFDTLLLRDGTNKLCLFCHDGSDPSAPDVLAPVSMYSSSGDEYSGAGFFTNLEFDNPTGHDLGGNGSDVPFGTGNNVVLSCASCHDPHGTTNYRNVLTSPAGGTGVPVKVGVDVFRDAAPGDPPSPAASILAYRQSNLGYRSGTTPWCTECHDELKQAINNPGNRGHHLLDVPINGFGTVTDPAHWVAGIGTGCGVATGDTTEGVPRLRFQVSTATDYVSARTVAPDNEVMCVTCHLAHGGPWETGFVWPTEGDAGPTDRDSGCNQCHNL